MSKIVVVGANHAGTACINTMLDNFGNENEIVVFDQNSNISFLGCGMALWIGEQIDGAEGLFYSDKEKLEAKGAKVYMNSPVLSIDYDNKVVTAEVEGQEHKESYDKLIFATGSTPILPPIEGVEIVKGNREFKATLENVQFVKLYQNAEEVINKLADKSKHLERIAVVGGGYIGVELAEAFERLGKEVVLVDIVDTVLNGYYDKDFTQMMAKNLEDHNIRLALGQTVKAIEGEGKVERLITDKETFDVDMVVLAVGFRPNTALADGKIELLSLIHIYSVYDIEWAPGVKYGEIFLQPEYEHSKYSFEVSDQDMLLSNFEKFEKEAGRALELGLVHPAYDYVLKCSHTFNLLDARGAVSVTERAGYIARIRNLARVVAKTFVAERKKLGYPLLDEATRAKLLAEEEE